MKPEAEAKAAKSDSQREVVAAKRNSLMPEETGQPSGLENKTTEAD